MPVTARFLEWEMLLAWGRFRHEYEALPRWEKREMQRFWWWRTEREQLIHKKQMAEARAKSRSR